MSETWRAVMIGLCLATLALFGMEITSRLRAAPADPWDGYRACSQLSAGSKDFTILDMKRGAEATRLSRCYEPV